jgi:DNA-binding response OmpR family regulator
MRVLIADDDHDLAQLVGQCARVLWPGCGLALADNGREALRRFKTEPPDLVILDVTMPPPDGLTVCGEIRASSSVPILMLTGHTGAASEVKALDQGADAYVTKPFDAVRLLARLRALSRRAALAAVTQDSPESAAAPRAMLTCDLAAREVRVGDAPVELSPTEYLLLELLARRVGVAVPQQALIAHAWGSAPAGPHYLKVYINRLRRKLGDKPGHPGFIQTSRGIGYRLGPNQVEVIQP